MLRIIFLMGLTAIPAFVLAEQCKELAGQYANNPESMDLNDLAKLRTCVTEQIYKQTESFPMGQPAPPPIPAVPMSEPPPAPVLGSPPK
jgi:hypothetical protein